MSSAFFRLNLKDISKALVVAVLVAVLGSIQQALTTHGLDVVSYDWSGILDVAWKAGVAYLGKNFLSNEDGKVLGRIG